MIKINLLPKTLNQKAVLRNTAIAFGVVLLVLIAAGVGYSFRLQSQVDAEQALATETEAYEQRVKAIQSQTAQLLASIQPIQAKLDFINNVLKYNLEYPKLYEQVARWTYDKAVLDAVTSDGAIVTLQGRVKSLDDLGRYMLNMYCATDLYTEVQITQATGIGGNSSDSEPYGNPSSNMGSQISGSQATQAGIEAITGSVSRTATSQSMWITFTAVCKLKNPIVAPTFAGGGAPPPGASVTPMGSSGNSASNMPDLEHQAGGM